MKLSSAQNPNGSSFQYYQPVNIKVALVGVEIWSESDRIMVAENGDTTLDSFLRYRRVHMLPDMPNDHAQLIT